MALDKFYAICIEYIIVFKVKIWQPWRCELHTGHLNSNLSPSVTAIKILTSDSY